MAKVILPDPFHSKTFIPFRYLVIFCVFTAGSISFAARNVLNVAILAMVDENGSSVDDDNATVIIQEIKFNWNQEDQGYILGAYFYTYTAAQIVFGVLTDKFNAVHLLIVSQTLAAIFSILCPIAANQGIIQLICSRMALGLAHGIIFPSCYVIIERWLSPGEKSIAQAGLSMGSNLGTAITMPITAWLCENGFAGGWPSAFYVVGIVNLLLITLWSCCLTLNPSNNRWVSEEEKRKIESWTISKDSKVKTKITKTPWSKLFTSLPLWSVMIARGSNGLVFYAINSKIPVYMETVLGYSLRGNAGINSLFYVAICTSQTIAGPASRYIIAKGWLPKTTTRKIFETVALLGPCACLLSVPNLGNNPNAIVVALILSMFFNGFSLGGDIPIVPEMAPHLVGTTFGFANTLGSSAGFIAPIVIAAIVGEQVHSQSQWSKSFYSFAGLQVLGTLIFWTFATTDPQPWGTIQNTESPKGKTELHLSDSVAIRVINEELKTERKEQI